MGFGLYQLNLVDTVYTLVHKNSLVGFFFYFLLKKIRTCRAATCSMLEGLNMPGRQNFFLMVLPEG